MKKSFLWIIVFMALLFSCSKREGTVELTLASIEIIASNGTQLELGEETQLSVEGIDQFGNPITITSQISWTSNSAIVNINASGLVTAVSSGKATAQATTQNISSTIEIIVDDSASDFNYNIYVSDAGNFDKPPWQILKYDKDGENPEVFIDEALAWPQDILFLEEENVVLISNLRSGAINRHDATTGEFLSRFAAVPLGPTRMKFGPDSLLYVLQWNDIGKVLRFQRDGTPLGAFTDSGIPSSIGLDWDEEGNLYVASFGFAEIRKFGPNGEDLGIFANSEFAGPTNINFDAQGNLMVNDWTKGRVMIFDEEGNFIKDFTDGLSQVEGLSILPNGDILLGHGRGKSIKLYKPDGVFIRDVVERGGGGLIQPNAVIWRKIKG